jgi:hypothetical protein
MDRSAPSGAFQTRAHIPSAPGFGSQARIDGQKDFYAHVREPS